MAQSDDKKSTKIPDDLLEKAKNAQERRSYEKSLGTQTSHHSDQNAHQTDTPSPDSGSKTSPKNSQVAHPRKRLSSQDLDLIAQQYEQSTGISPWVGYGFTSSGGANPETIYLFTMNKEHSCLELHLDNKGIYSLKNETGELLWSGFSLDDMAQNFF